MRHKQVLEAIVARLKGEWNHPSLLRFGELMPNTNEDLLRFAEEALDLPENYFVLTIKTPEGEQVFVLSSNGKAADALNGYIEANWGTLPTDRPISDFNSPVEYYFRCKEEESFSIHECYVNDMEINPYLKNDLVSTLKV